MNKKVNVLVVGGGPAGIGAAYSAAKSGARTLLVESQGALGGVSTNGMMSHWTGHAESRLYRMILDESQKYFLVNKKYPILINTEALKVIYEKLLASVGAEILLYTFAYDTIMDGNKVKGVRFLNKSGFIDIEADVIIDASGDGDIAFHSGAEFVKGRQSDGKMQPMTLMFRVGGVDIEKVPELWSFETTYETDKGELQELGKELLPFPMGHVLIYKSPLPGIVTINMTNCIDVDGTRAEDMTKAEIVCRKQVYPVEDFLRKYVPGCEQCFVLASASMIGVRETRHFKGLKTLTDNDILEARFYEDWIVRGARFEFDVHNMTGSGLDATGCQKFFSQKNGYTIPYGCLIPEKIDGLLIAGRCISGTHLAHSSYRAMPICLAMGEGAGVAAAIAAEQKVSLRDVDVKQIQARLL